MAHDWRPGATVDMLRRRAAVVARIRAYFDASGACEVTTPVLSRYATSEPTLVNLALEHPAGDAFRYLRTSPESAMKRLLAEDSGDIYEIGPVFRGDEAGRRHLTEFTLLEWYRTGFDHRRLMDDIEALLEVVDLGRAPTRLSYADLWARHIGGDPHTISTARLAAIAAAASVHLSARDREDRALLFDCIYAQILEPALAHAGAVLLHDYPREMRAYARLSERDPPIAERFELVVDGIEVANGYHEITRVDEQRACFDEENALRLRRGLARVEGDGAWLAALGHGLPACAGAALGIERLLMVMTGATRIADTTAFGA